MRRRIRFPPSFREKLAANEAAVKAMSPTGELPERMQAQFDALRPKPRRSRLPVMHSPDKPPLERDIQAAIIEALRLQPHVIKVIRFNAGGAYYRNAQGKDALVLFSSEPVVDLYVLMRGKRESERFDLYTPGRTAWLEVKRPDWSKPRDLREERQAAFLQCVREAGGIGAFVRSVEEAIAAMQ